MARDLRRSTARLGNLSPLVWIFLILFIAVAMPTARTAHAWDGLETVPREIVLSNGMARQQILVATAERDLTRDAAYRSEQPSVATVDASGYVTPIANGTTAITIEADGRTIKVDVRVSGMSDGRSVDFVADIVPILSRHGCNSGGCHGKAGGQNGFQLSLFGFDNAFDHDAIAKEGRGRRIFTSSTGRSMLLAKATGSSPHGGGARFGIDSEAAQLIQRWIELGAPASSPESPRVVKLHVTPPERILSRDGRQQLAVTAEYSDGSRRDVTRQSEFSSNLDPVAGVDEDGFVTATGQSGEAAIMARYVGHVAVFHAIVPHGSSLESIPDFTPNNYVDELAAAMWKKLGLLPSPNSDDATFLRRVTIDLCGRLPTAEEAIAFVEDKSGSKRREVIDRLLDSPDYPAYFAMRWGAILRNSRLAGADQASYAFHNWIKDMIARNRPYDEFVRGVVAAAGEWQDAPAINWYWQTRDDQLHSVTADTAQVFLGIRLQCARCHHHPYERWGQEDYYGLAGFFTRLGRKSFGQPPPYYASSKVTTGEKNPLTGQVPEPKFLDGEYGKFTPEDDPRHALVDWMAKPENPFFARVLVNRLWGHFMGRGLVNEVDDMRESNPPSNPELLDKLAQDFIDHNFDVRHIVQTLVNSRVYQLSSEPTEHNKDDRQNFARFYARRLIAEVLLDAVDDATGTKTKFGNISDSARAVDLPHEGFGSYFLDTFDRPKRVSGCECERSSGATLAQVLLLANSDELENKLADGKGRIAKLMADKKPIPEMIDSIYLNAYARRPSDQELSTTVGYVEAQENKQQALEDVLWTVINSKEFLFNH
ncbi:MAG: DUF1549 and DUF1553 domain-containing protein [Planctomycetota bacterium]|nr:DUF1549 and DUF1553 domain-containing protein [Planctomycetota bacterium]